MLQATPVRPDELRPNLASKAFSPKANSCSPPQGHGLGKTEMKRASTNQFHKSNAGYRWLALKLLKSPPPEISQPANFPSTRPVSTDPESGNINRWE
jgi:hypothetical protein